MNIIHIITSLNDGGAEAVLYRLCSFENENTHVVVSLMDEGKYGSLLEKEGIIVHCLNMPPGRVKVNGLFNLYRLFRKVKPDVVQTWMYHADLIGGIVARLAGIRPVIWGVRHTDFDKNKTSLKTRVVVRICGLLSRFIPQAIICNSHKAIQTHESLGYQTQSIIVIPNGYPLDRFHPDLGAGHDVHSELSNNKDFCLLGMVSRFNPQKDHENLIRALNRLKESSINFKCLLVGSGIDANNKDLNNTIDQYGLNDSVLLLGQRDDIPSVMNALDLHILSSAYGEAFPNVIAEAMACGTPCVTTDVGDAALIVGDTGWVVPPREPEKLADAIIEAIKEKENYPEQWEQRKLACRQRIVDNFSLEKMIAAYNKVWRDACDIKA